MTSPSPLERLAGPGNVLAKEPPDAKEFEGLVRSGLARLKDAQNDANALESRFDLAYSAAHALMSGVASAPRISGIETVHRFSGAAGHSWRWGRKSGASCRSATICGIGTSTKAPSMLMRGWSWI